MESKTAPPGSLVRGMSLVWLNKAGPLDSLGLHAKVDNTLQAHGYAPVALSHVSTALSSLNAKSFIKPDDADATRYVSAEDGNDLLFYAALRVSTTPDEDGFDLACVLSHEARV